MPIKNYPQNFGKAKVMEFNKYKNFAARNFYYLAKECTKNRKSPAVAGLHRIFFNKPGTCCFYFTGIGEETRLLQHFSDYLFQKKSFVPGTKLLNYAACFAFFRFIWVTSESNASSKDS
jgi:hypothetical protein